MNISPVGNRIRVYHWGEIVFILLCQSFQMESKTNESRIISADEVYINMSDELIHNPHVTALHKRFAHNYDFFHQRGIVHDSTSVMALAHHKRPCSSQAVPHILAKANAQHKRCLIPPRVGGRVKIFSCELCQQSHNPAGMWSNINALSTQVQENIKQLRTLHVKSLSCRFTRHLKA